MVEEHLRRPRSGLTVADVIVVHVAGRNVLGRIHDKHGRTLALAAFQEDSRKLIGGQPLNGDDIEW